MKVLKKLLIALVALLALLLGAGMLLSPKYQLSRSVTIQAPPEKIYPLVAAPRGWKSWSAWNQRDPDMDISYSGPASGPGAVWAWKSRGEGASRMTFTAADAPRRLDYELYFPDVNSTSTGQFRFEANGNATQVTWTMDGNMGANPIYRWMGLFMDKLVGPDFAAGLANLKALAEKP